MLTFFLQPSNRRAQQVSTGRLRMFSRKFAVLAVAAFSLTLASDAAAQASFTPSYNSPYRAFNSSEFGGILSFPDGASDFAVEGVYRFARGAWDVGIKGGIIDAGSTAVIAGVEGRLRVMDHTQQDFPLDGAVVVGLGTFDFDRFLVPSAGLSLGRNVQLEDFSFTAYGQPTVFLATGSGSTDFNFGLGLGVDFQIAEAVDLRTSFGLVDGPNGISFAFVWIR